MTYLEDLKWTETLDQCCYFKVRIELLSKKFIKSLQKDEHYSDFCFRFKIIDKRIVKNDYYWEHLLPTELSMSMELRHPNIVSTFDIFWVGDNIVVIVMEMLTHGNLQERLSQLLFKGYTLPIPNKWVSMGI